MRHSDLASRVSIEFIEADVRSVSFGSSDFVEEYKLDQATTAYVCLNDDSASVFAAITMRRWLNNTTPIVVRIVGRVGAGDVTRNDRQ